MYKTVRHGENSLQYTILPQTEEVLSNSGMKGKGRDYSPSIHVRRSRRRFSAKNCILLTCGLFTVTLIAFVTIYVLNQKLLDPWLQTGRREIMSSVLKYREMKPTGSPLTSKVETSSTTSTTTYATTTVTIPTVSKTVERSTSPPWILPALRSWKSSSTIQTIPTEGSEIIPPEKPKSRSKELTAEDNMSIKPWEKDTIIRPTATPESITLNSIIKYYSRAVSPSEKPVFVTTKTFDDVLITTKHSPVTETTENSKMNDLKDALLSVDDDEDFKESLEVDEVFSLPPLKPDTGSPYIDVDEVTMSKPAIGWYGSRWPFVDTASYFQWSGYNRGDNLLLPLLVGALSSLALICLLGLAAKRRRRSQPSSAQSGNERISSGRGRGLRGPMRGMAFSLPSFHGKIHTTELAVDDNTNLLTAENEEAEE